MKDALAGLFRDFEAFHILLILAIIFAFMLAERACDLCNKNLDIRREVTLEGIKEIDNWRGTVEKILIKIFCECEEEVK